jgi:hypothetical protein
LYGHLLYAHWLLDYGATENTSPFKNWREGKEWNRSTEDGFETISRDSNDYLDTTALFGVLKKSFCLRISRAAM